MLCYVMLCYGYDETEKTMVADLSKFFSESVKFHLSTISSVLSGTPSCKCLLELRL